MTERGSLRIPAALIGLAMAGSVQGGELRIDFCPKNVVRPYPLESLRGVQGLLLQNVAIANTGREPVRLRSIEVELLRDGTAIDRRTLDTAALATAAKTGKGLQDQGMVDQIGFQFCDGRLLRQRRLAASETLAPGEALLVMQQVFAWKGVRDQLRVRVIGEDAEAAAALRIDGATTRTVFRWPLKGGPWSVAGASFHGTHRWGVPEEFALDIVRPGADGRSFKDGGRRNQDFHAYGAEVVAAASGTVVEALTGGKELAPLLRHPGESLEAYFGRVGAQQARNLAGGMVGIAGETVILDHGGNEYSVYAHLQPGSLRVKAGDKVSAGRVIGRLGSSGNSTEPHLHFQVCDRPSGLSCSALIPTFERIEILNTDGPRPLQSGDVVEAVE